MKALTLTQPYASLVANGDKRVETRSWRTSYRGPVLIHSASTLKGVGGKNGYVEALHRIPDLALLRLETFCSVGPDCVPPGLPLGAVVAVSYLEDVVEVDEAVRGGLSRDELAVGGYDDGRYAWFLRKALAVSPFPYRGALGLWDLHDDDLPERLVRAGRAIQHAVAE